MAAFGTGWHLRPDSDRAVAPAFEPASDVGAVSGGAAGATLQSGKGGSAPAFGSAAAGEGIQRYLDGNGTIRPQDMERALRDALRESDPLKSNLLFTQLLQELTPENVEQALAVLREAPQGWEMYQKLGLFVGAWGGIDGPKALEYAKELPGPGRIFGSAAALSGWAAADPEAAIAWVEANQSEGGESVIAKAGILRGLAVNDPARATAYLEQLPADTEGLGQLVETVANEQMKQGINAATTWAANLSTDALKKDAFQQLGEEYARQDPVQAASWIESHAGNAYAGEAVEEIADEWAEIDPASAVGWAETLPETTRANAMESAFQEWEESDAAGASAYLQGMESSPAKDAAISGFVADLGGEEPAMAIQWAESIESEATRTKALTDVATDWYQADPVAAGAWIENSGLPVESVQQITAPRDNRAEMFRRFMQGVGR